jgi:hypothetical protein
MPKTDRWYDKYPELGKLIERLRGVDEDEREAIFDGIKELDKDFDSELIDRHVMEFPMNLRRRWYDRDPYSWLVINALKYAEKPLIQKVIEYLKEKLKFSV